jgi:hypothetical protein
LINLDPIHNEIDWHFRVIYTIQVVVIYGIVENNHHGFLVKLLHPTVEWDYFQQHTIGIKADFIGFP